MITGKDFKTLGFEWDDDYRMGWIYDEDPTRTWTVDDEDGTVYIRESDNYHGMSFEGVKNQSDIRALYYLLTGSQLKH